MKWPARSAILSHKLSIQHVYYHYYYYNVMYRCDLLGFQLEAGAYGVKLAVMLLI